MEPASGPSSMPALQGISDPVAHRIVASAADLALVVEGGTVVEVGLGEGFEPHEGWASLLGRRWADTVLKDSAKKATSLLQDAAKAQTTRPREINQQVEGLGSVPLRCTGALLGDDRLVILGHDLRPLAELQQRMVSAQQAMDVEYRRLRQADTRYRVLFHVSAEGVLIVKREGRTVVEANPAASTLLGETAEALKGRRLHELFADSSRDELSTLIGATEAGATGTSKLETADGDGVTATAATFRQAGSNLLLFRFWRADRDRRASRRDRRMLDVLDAIPDGFVVTGEDRRVLSANPGFCELVQRADEAQVVGKSLERWLGRPGVDLNIIVANLRERGVVRNFATIVRGDFGSEQEVVVTAVSALDGTVPSFGFTVQPVGAPIEGPSTSILPRSVEQLRGLVGRVSLKEIVREATDMIERLCIEAALDVSSNNRAAAAQLLGLSRQSLYSKLRRHGLGEFQPS